MKWSGLFVMLATAAGGICPAQEPVPEGTRGLWSTEFRRARAETARQQLTAAPAAPTRPASNNAPPRPNRQVASASTTTASAASPASSAAALIGVTVWHLRPSRPADPAAVRAIVHEKSANRPHTPVRVSSQTRFFEGDHLRLTIESGRAGYLYVVSRERYADGTTGAHQLIFPTTRLRNGDNRVRAGYPVEIPSSADDPSYFTMQRSRADHVGEEVLFIVAPQPIAGVNIGEDAIELSDALVKSWQAKWMAKVQSIDAPAEQEQPLTPEEVKLLRAGSVFQETDPLPQTLYRVEGESGQPVLVAMQLKMKQ